MENKIANKIKEISDLLVEEIDNENIGLHTGTSGILLFLTYYYKLSKEEKYLNKTLDIISKSVKTINDGYYDHTICNGIGGLLWSINHIMNNGAINNNDVCDLFNSLDEYVAINMLEDIKNNNYDFLHGAIGSGIYFLNRLTEPTSKEYLIQLVDELDNKSCNDNDGLLKWESTEQAYDKNPLGKFNLSISHGMASIISFLSKLYLKNIYKDKVNYLLEGAVKYILKNRLDSKIYISNFPSWVSDKTELTSSRLAWCYGDLGISIALYNAAKAFNNKEWEKISIEVLLHASNRRDLESELVRDAGICHGASGISHIYNRMYRNTGVVRFKETSDFWIQETIKMAKFKDGLAGYKVFRTEEHGGMINDYTLLEGITGIGLALISSYPHMELNWDECLLLS